ncbi:hypothetical protein ANN_06628 [Periplaneta americana]|uniref:Uncharacterized protein n=1 Tax=Periplaneta americana TaxID=6978 RepID=A0ABQ8TFA7_PERAM|nr:hypothetical protein ANN_06628 [Periplaneta americana]
MRSLKYIRGHPRRGRRDALPPCYPPESWNGYEEKLLGHHRTNNISEGWHNRFMIVVGKHHPPVYGLLNEFVKEEADTETTIAQMELGQVVRKKPKKKWLCIQARIQNIVSEYTFFREEERLGGTLRHNFV